MSIYSFLFVFVFGCNYLKHKDIGNHVQRANHFYIIKIFKIISYKFYI